MASGLYGICETGGHRSTGVVQLHTERIHRVHEWELFSEVTMTVSDMLCLLRLFGLFYIDKFMYDCIRYSVKHWIIL